MSRRRRLLLVVPLALVLAVGAAFAVFAIRGSDEPPPPALAEPSGAQAQAQAPGDAGDGARELRVGDGSFVGYRVRETFAAIGVVDAVGRTEDVEGTARVDGERLVAADLEADLTSLRSDEARRDAALRTRGIETDRFPTARFSLAAPAAVVPAPGERARATVRGRLELHGRTREVRARVEVQRRGDGLELVGQAPIAFADFAIEPPSIAGFVTVRDEGTLEFRVVLG